MALLCIEINKWLVKKKLRHFASPKQLPILGIAGRFIFRPSAKLIEVILEIYDEVKVTPIQMWFGPCLLIGVSEPQDIQIVLTDEHCLNKPYYYKHLKCDTSLNVTDKKQWKPDRRALNAAFNINMLQSYVPLLNDKSRILTEKMKPFLRESGDMFGSIFIGMMDMISRTTMGIEMQLQSDHGRNIYPIVKQLMANIQYRILHVWLWLDLTYSLTTKYREDLRILKEIDDFIDEMYDKKVREIEYLKSQGIDYLAEAKTNNTTDYMEKCLILEQDGIFSHENFLDHMRLAFIAGIDTSTITVYGVLLMLAIHQDHQELVLAELRSIFDSDDCEVTHSHQAKMKYTERVIKETLRLLPPGPLIGRYTSAEVELTKGTVPKGTMIAISIIHLHRNPETWGENANEFDPNRFLPENIAKRPPFCYIPFSGGPRNCIGMKYAMISAKITLAHLLRRYKFTTKLRLDEIRLETHLTATIINENPMRIEERGF